VYALEVAADSRARRLSSTEIIFASVPENVMCWLYWPMNTSVSMAMLDLSRYVGDSRLLMLFARVDSVCFFIGMDAHGMLFFAEVVRLLTR
jgi:hypothetical protein